MEEILNKYHLLTSIKSESYKNAIIEIIELKNLVKLEESQKNKKTTPKGFEPLRTKSINLAG